jgi:NAD(P)H dehydrogenase (quinone)
MSSSPWRAMSHRRRIEERRDVMTRNRVLVTAASGKVGRAVAAQLLEKGVPTRALVHREDARSARLRDLGAEIVVADMMDIPQVAAAMEGVDRLFFNAPFHPHALDSAVAFAVAAQRSGLDAVVAMGQWAANPEHPSLLSRHAWLTDKLFGLLPNTAHVAVDPGYFADNYLTQIPMAAQLGIFPTPTGLGRNAPPSNEDIARVAVGALLDPHRHDGHAYRPTGPKLMTGQEIADAIGEALGRRVRHVDVTPERYMKAVHLRAKKLGLSMYLQTSLRHYLEEHALGSWEAGGVTTHVRDVAGVEPEDFLTIARRYAAVMPGTKRSAGGFLRALRGFMLATVMPKRDFDEFDRIQQQPRPAQPKYSGRSTVWRAEHPARYPRVDGITLGSTLASD